MKRHRSHAELASTWQIHLTLRQDVSLSNLTYLKPEHQLALPGCTADRALRPCLKQNIKMRRPVCLSVFLSVFLLFLNELTASSCHDPHSHPPAHSFSSRPLRRRSLFDFPWQEDKFPEEIAGSLGNSVKVLEDRLAYMTQASHSISFPFCNLCSNLSGSSCSRTMPLLFSAWGEPE